MTAQGRQGRLDDLDPLLVAAQVLEHPGPVDRQPGGLDLGSLGGEKAGRVLIEPQTGPILALVDQDVAPRPGSHSPTVGVVGQSGCLGGNVGDPQGGPGIAQPFAVRLLLEPMDDGAGERPVAGEQEGLPGGGILRLEEGLHHVGGRHHTWIPFSRTSRWPHTRLRS